MSDEPWPTLPQDPGSAAHAAAGGRCPTCTYPVTPWAIFCEGCGSPLLPTEPPPQPILSEGSTGTRRLGASARRSCAECGGTIGEDGYCQTCGVLAPAARDHVESSPADWVAGVSDRGIVHHRNEDALALWADDERAVLVVCDGVSTSEDSDVAALAAAERARDVLLEHPDLVLAASEANRAVVAATAPDSANTASATLAMAVVSRTEVRFASLGDSRVYWLGDDPVLLSLDDSVAQQFIAQGMPRAEAETMPSAHAITRWLGRDADDVTPRVGSHPLTGDGWLVVCSDGLWNYASEPAALAAQVAAAAAAGGEPLAVARRLVEWANEQGGRDNITVALARCRRLDEPSVPGEEIPDRG